MSWTKEKLDEETKKLQATSEDEIIVKGLKRGRPKKSKTVKTNLDLSEDLAIELDFIAEFLGSTRQSVVKGFILNGLKDYYYIRDARKQKVKK